MEEVANALQQIKLNAWESESLGFPAAARYDSSFWEKDRVDCHFLRINELGLGLFRITKKRKGSS